MQVLELNLASRPFKNDTLLWVGFLTGLVLLGWASWWNVQAYTGHRELIASVHESNTSMRERFARIDLRGKAAVKEIEGYEKMILASQPGGRLGLPEEIAEAAVWLCSDRASFVSGSSMLVDGAAVAR